jgi:hypothetical protein
MNSSKDEFKNAIDKAYITQPNVKLNTDTIGDAIKYKSGFTEEVDDDGNEYETFLEKNKKSKNSAKNQFSKDVAKDRDYIGFKKAAEYKDEKGEVHSFGTPNAVRNDPFINKKKHSRVGKRETKEASTTGTGGFVAPLGFKDSEFVRRSFAETPKLKESEVEKVEATEATTGVGGYSSPAMWAKSTSKKDWGPSRKTQYPGGGFVKIKKKCTKFPYCNQGDINNLKISKNESVKEAIDNVAKKLGVSKNVIMSILEHEYENVGKRIK